MIGDSSSNVKILAVSLWVGTTLEADPSPAASPMSNATRREPESAAESRRI